MPTSDRMERRKRRKVMGGLELGLGDGVEGEGVDGAGHSPATSATVHQSSSQKVSSQN